MASASLPGASLAQEGRATRIVVLGDSLSAGFLLPSSSAFPAVLEGELRRRGHAVTVANAAVPMDTTWDGLARLDRDVPDGTDGVILELGANDRLRFADPEVTRSYLEQIVRRLEARRIPVLLAGIRFPEGLLGEAARFNAVFPDVARRHRLAFYPDFYAGLWGEPGLKIIDGIHPSPTGVQRIVAGVLPTVERFLGRVRGASATRGRRATRA